MKCDQRDEAAKFAPLLQSYYGNDRKEIPIYETSGDCLSKVSTAVHALQPFSPFHGSL